MRLPSIPITHTPSKSMSGFKNFAIAGAGTTGSFITHQFLKDKVAGTVNEVVVLTRQVSPPEAMAVGSVERSVLTNDGRDPKPQSKAMPR